MERGSSTLEVKDHEQRHTANRERDNCSLPGKTASVPDRQGFDFTSANATRTYAWEHDAQLVQDWIHTYRSPENTIELLTYHHRLHAVAGSADSSRQNEKP